MNTWPDDRPEDDDGEPQQTHDGIPITGYYIGEPVPDLSLLPKDGWRDALRPLSPRARRQSMASASGSADVQAAMILVGDLMLSDPVPWPVAPPPRMPTGDPPARGAGHQLNFRLGPSDYARLVKAAKLFAMRPTTLARVLTMRGVELALYEERRDR